MAETAVNATLTFILGAIAMLVLVIIIITTFAPDLLKPLLSKSEEIVFDGNGEIRLSCVAGATDIQIEGLSFKYTGEKTEALAVIFMSGRATSSGEKITLCPKEEQDEGLCRNKFNITATMLGAPWDRRDSLVVGFFKFNERCRELATTYVRGESINDYDFRNVCQKNFIGLVSCNAECGQSVPCRRG